MAVRAGRLKGNLAPMLCEQTHLCCAVGLEINSFENGEFCLFFNVPEIMRSREISRSLNSSTVLNTSGGLFVQHDITCESSPNTASANGSVVERSWLFCLFHRRKFHRILAQFESPHRDSDTAMRRSSLRHAITQGSTGHDFHVVISDEIHHINVIRLHDVGCSAGNSICSTSL
jgi:hypothetical protein